MFLKKTVAVFLLLTSLFLSPAIAKNTDIVSDDTQIQAVEASRGESKYPDYAKMYTGDDKYEKFNRKMFSLNSKLNKYIARPVHILWSSIMPKYGIDRIRDVYNNIEYPKRLASCILQKDGKGAKIETLRFLTNTTLGLGGLFDPADRILKIKPTNENMEQALCKCKVNSGSYLVVPILNSCTPRSLCGRALEAALDPSVYLASPITTAIKFGLMLNKTSYMQPLAKMIETNYADPYDIHKKLFGMENYIRNHNLDREELIIEEKMLVEQGKTKEAEELVSSIGDSSAPVLKENNTNVAANINHGLGDILPLGKNAIKADLVLEGYKSQTPVVDSMRTVLFENPDINKSIWNELSVWNRSFAKRVKTGSIILTDGKPLYQFKYILQKDKKAPLVIIYPSIGEGAGTHHSIVFAKMFYDAGYSVIMQGSHFHWEFVKSMPDGYFPGLPIVDSEHVQDVTHKIINFLSKKYECEFGEKTILGTSFGAMAALFIGDRETSNALIGVNKYIAISPPIDLWYAISQLDKNGDEFDKSSNEVKQKTAVTAAKILQLYEMKSTGDLNIETLPFSDEEGKLITTFILRQKLSDLIFTLEKAPKNQKTDIYETINNMSYRDYAEKYLGLNADNKAIISEKTLSETEKHILPDFDDKPIKNTDMDVNSDKDQTSLFSISKYLSNSNNYVIYHSLDDYFINQNQLKKLKNIAGEKLTCINCGAHLGYLYRQEFLSSLMRNFNKG